MADLVTVAEAKAHLNITHAALDSYIALEVSAASEMVLARTGALGDATWTEATAPAPVRWATLQLIGHLHAHRGDDASGAWGEPDQAIWAAVDRMLMGHGYKDPVVA